MLTKKETAVAAQLSHRILESYVQIEEGEICLWDVCRSIGEAITDEEQKSKFKNGFSPPFYEYLSEILWNDTMGRYTPSELKYIRAIYNTYKNHESLELYWPNYYHLVLIEDSRERVFYEIEAAYNNWADAELVRQIQAGLYKQTAIPAQSIQIEKWPEAVIVPTRDQLLVADSVKSTHIKDRLVIDVDEPEEIPDAPALIRVRSFPKNVLEMSSLGEFKCEGRLTQGTSEGGKFYIGCGGKLFRLDNGDKWETAAESGTFRLFAPPKRLTKGLYSLWFDEWDEFCIKASRTQGSETKFGPEIRDEYAPTWASWNKELYVRSKLDNDKTALYRLNENSLELDLLGNLEAGDVFQVVNNLLFCHEKQSAKLEGDKDANGIELEIEEFGVVDQRFELSAKIDSVTMYDIAELNLQKRWEVSGEIKAINYVPRLRGVLVTQQVPRGIDVEVITSNSPNPMLAMTRRGALIGNPVLFETHLGWLIHKGNNSFLAEEWPPPKERSGIRYYPEYALELYELESNSWKSLSLNFDEPLVNVYAWGHKLVIETLRQVIVFKLLDAWNTAGETGGAKLEVFQSSVAADKAFLEGVSTKGPKKDDLAYLLDGDMFRQVVRRELDISEPQHIPDDPSAQIEILNELTSKLCDEVLNTWPDSLHVLAKKCPTEFMKEVDSADYGHPAASPFGSLRLRGADPASLVRRVVEWRSMQEAKLKSRMDEQRSLTTARFLLYSYIRYCKIKGPVNEIPTRWEDRYSVDSVAAMLGGSVGTMLSWLNLEQVQPDDIEAWAKSNWWTRRRIQKEARGRIEVETLGRLAEKWPGGCPLFLQDTNGYIEFVKEVVYSRLLALNGRSRLQEAVNRSWQNPVTRQGRQIFISYSHRDAKLAGDLATGLRDLGLGVTLDTFDLSGEAGDWEVETWIAENIMRSDALVFVVSKSLSESSWVNREAEWAYRLLGVKSSCILPYIVLLDDVLDLTEYPAGRIIDARRYRGKADWNSELVELAARITLDSLMNMRAVNNRTFWAPQDKERILDGGEIVAIPEFPD